jgi:hypothetical protein
MHFVNITRPVSPPAPKLLLTAKETAASLGVSTKTLYLWDRDGTLPLSTSRRDACGTRPRTCSVSLTRAGND